MFERKKAVSPIIATVILIAFVIAVAAIVTSSLTTVIKTQTTTAETASKACTGAALNIISSSATSSLQIAVENLGPNAMSNFTITAKRADNSLYTNTTAAATLSIAKGSSAIITIPDINSTSGCPLSMLRVSGGNCPVSIEIDNSTKSIC